MLSPLRARDRTRDGADLEPAIRAFSEKSGGEFRSSVTTMFNAVTHCNVWVTDQDEALDFMPEG
jgi:hypothetical protein